MEVRVDRVGALVLLDVGLELVDDPDPATLVSRRVHDDAIALRCDPFHRRAKLDAAIASQGAESVPGQAFGVDAGKDAIAPRHAPGHQRYVDVPAGGFERTGIELTERCRQYNARDFRDR